jgi:uncharacterized protein YaiL (DUF2058 family)
MGNSLLDQLKKSGLVDEQKARQVAKEKQKQAKQRSAKKARQPNASQRAAQQAQAAQVARDKQLNRQRQQAAERQALQAQIRQLIEQHAIAREGGELPFHFQDGNRVARIYLSQQLREQLLRGALTIVRWRQGYHLLAAEAAEKIRQRDPERIVQLPPARPDEPDQDDPYAAYQVPDDLIW